MAKTMFSVIIPAYNEERTIRASVEKLHTVLSGARGEFEIIISEDGSTDRTHEIAKSLERDGIKVLHMDDRQGKGAAIKKAIQQARGENIIFMDADMASDPDHVLELAGRLENGAEIVIGSRYLAASEARRTLLRDVASRSFNFLVRLVLGSALTDHQCGLKAFRKASILPLINEVESRDWFWDAELLVRAQRKGIRVEEVPIRWVESGDSKFRLVKDTYHMGMSLARFRLKGR